MRNGWLNLKVFETGVPFAIAQGSSEANISFVVEDGAVQQALLATHREFGLGAQESNRSQPI